MVQAFTNRIGGIYQKYNSVSVSSRKGMYYGSLVDDKYFADLLVGTSYKSDTIKSDRVRPTPYSRAIISTLVDTPTVYRYSADYWGYIPFDYTFEEYMSTWYPTWFFLEPSGLTPQRENAGARAVTTALNNLNSSNTQLGADIGESKKTLNMVADRTKTLAEFTRDFRRRNYAKILKDFSQFRSREASKLWLEFIYGWKPLASSIYELSQVLGEQLEKDQLIYSRGSSSFSDTNKYTIGSGDFNVEYSGGFRCQIIARVEVPSIVRLNALGVLNPASVAWELVPFSFVLDWFIPIGNVLAGLSSTAGLSFHSGYVTTVNRAISTLKPQDRSWTSRFERFAIQQRGNTVRESFDMRRNVMGSFPLPQLYANTNPFSTTRVINATAIVRQLF